MKYKTRGLNQLSDQLHEFQILMGFTDDNIIQRLMLAASEIFEAFEAYRKGKRADTDLMKKGADTDFIDIFEFSMKDTLEDEIADAIIRLLAFCGENGIDIEFQINQKMKYNETRGYKYRGKKF